MPDFGSPFAGLANDRKLSHEELVRAVRFMVSAEYEAVQLYMQLAESTDNKLGDQSLLFRVVPLTQPKPLLDLGRWWPT